MTEPTTEQTRLEAELEGVVSVEFHKKRLKAVQKMFDLELKRRCKAEDKVKAAWAWLHLNAEHTKHCIRGDTKYTCSCGLANLCWGLKGED